MKSRFASRLFDKLTITNAPNPMARATAELGAAFLTYCARDVDRYRNALRKPSNHIYSGLHLHGTTEYLAGREITMIGFGRVGRALPEVRDPKTGELVRSGTEPGELVTRWRLSVTFTG